MMPYTDPEPVRPVRRWDPPYCTGAALPGESMTCGRPRPCPNHDRTERDRIAKLADPDTGLSERAKQVLRAVGRGEVFQLPGPPKQDRYQPSDMSKPQPVTTFAMGLRARGLIRLARKATQPAIAAGESVRMWHLTADGEAVLALIGGAR